jgi:ubiquitin-conjugating enzyme E2 J2
MWSVGTILVGLQSFMLDKQATVGSVETSDGEKRRLATKTLEYNVTNKDFRRLFPELVELHQQQQEARQRSAAAGGGGVAAPGAAGAGGVGSGSEAEATAAATGGAGERNAGNTWVVVLVVIIAVAVAYLQYTERGGTWGKRHAFG